MGCGVNVSQSERRLQSVGGETELLLVVTQSDAHHGVLSHNSVAILKAAVKCVIRSMCTHAAHKHV